jgi:hypothetical protein
MEDTTREALKDEKIIRYIHLQVHEKMKKSKEKYKY